MLEKKDSLIVGIQSLAEALASRPSRKFGIVPAKKRNLKVSEIKLYFLIYVGRTKL